MSLTGNVFSQICLRIIKEQENIIGTLSWDEAYRVPGLVVDRYNKSVRITGDPRKAIDNLVECYVKLFGKLSKDVSRESVVDLIADIPQEEIPENLKS